MNHLTTYLTLLKAYLSEKGRDEEGADAPSWIFITVAVIVLAGLVYAAITGFVNGQISQLGS